ncbi:MAG TPA: galactokinase [Candidatus Aquilonibacter sp.]|nr:galactokinase [Candidatus Aquilonibacter sp.]
MNPSRDVTSATLSPSQAKHFAAPARVNLIGEHTDYTGGLVMPMAIPFTTVAHLRAAADGRQTFTSEQFSTSRSITPEERSPRIGDWSDYPVGVLRELQALNIDVPPFELHINGNVPLGSGLSSSASIEVATAVALLSHAKTNLPSEQIATLCQRAENNYVGSPCGIMDQFVITAARAQHALLLNTRDLTFELLPMNQGSLASCRIVVANSGVRHSIASGDYGVRRREVEAGQAKLRERFPQLRDLGDATLEQLMACERELTHESFRRCRHIITENRRVLAARDAMLAGDPVALGSVMTAAHASERDDFECSIAEIDFLVDTAVQLPGCFGARLTGGGFGGCTVNLVDVAHTDEFVSNLRSAYLSRFGIPLETYICTAVDGAVARAAMRPNAANKER